jgi:hypothetical protein
MPNRTMPVARKSLPVDSQAGRVSTNATATSASSARAARTSASAPSSGGIGRSSPVVRHVEASSSTRPSPFRRASTRPASTTANSTASMDAGLTPWKVMARSRIPRPTAAAAIVGSLVKRPNTAAARACSRKVGDSTCPIGSPTAPARRNMARKARTDATVHTTVCSRRTGMPSVDARSARSAAPTMAMPTIERLKNAASATSTAGTTSMVSTSLALKIVPPSSKSHPTGGLSRVSNPSSPNARGSSSAAAVSTCATPMVATVTTSRGAVKKRRMTSISTSAPSTTAAASPATRPIQ